MSTIIKQKKGQFYIFMAIVLSTYALTLVMPKAAGPPQSSFKPLYENYLFEAPKVINSAIYNETSASARLANFTDSYMEFARAFDNKFGVMYAYSHDGITDIRSRLRDDANVTFNTTSFILRDNGTIVNGSGSFKAYVRGTAYEFNLSREDSFQALFISRTEQDVRVFKG